MEADNFHVFKMFCDDPIDMAEISKYARTVEDIVMANFEVFQREIELVNEHRDYLERLMETQYDAILYDADGGNPIVAASIDAPKIEQFFYLPQIGMYISLRTPFQSSISYQIVSPVNANFNDDMLTNILLRLGEIVKGHILDWVI